MNFKKIGFSAIALVVAAGVSLAGCDDGDGGNDGGAGGDSPSTGGRSGGSGGNGGNTGGSNPGTGGDGGAGPTPEFECPDGSETPDGDTIDADITSHVCLTADTEWFIDGIVFVDDGAELTIEPGTTIKGIAGGSADPSVLVVARGGKIHAEGTATHPIVFTSEFDAGERAAGDWGGVVLLGKAKNNAGANTRIEGFTITDERINHGGNDDADSSGEFSYVRIEYAGVDLGDGDEINGLTMGSIGSGTKIHHVMVSNSLDDAFEWFGGTADLSYLVANNAGDDMFDADNGFRGTLTNLFGRQIFVSSEDPNGFEWDSNRTDNTLVPLTEVNVENVTMCAQDQTPTNIGMMLRRGITGSISETVVVGFDIGYSARNSNWVVANPPVESDNSVLFELRTGQAQVRDGAFGYVGDASQADTDALAAAVAWFDDVSSNSTDALDFTAEDCLADDGPAESVTSSGRGAFKASATWLNEAWVNWETE